MFVPVYDTRNAARAGLFGLSGDPPADDPKSTDEKVDYNFLKSVWNFIKGIFNFGGKLIYGLKENEVKHILDVPNIFRAGFHAANCVPWSGNALVPCPGSFWADHWAKTFPFHWLDRPAFGDWYYRRFGFRWSLIEPGLGVKFNWFHFDPKTLNVVDGEGSVVAGQDRTHVVYTSGKDILEHMIGRGLWPGDETPEQAQASAKKIILENWQHKDNPANAGLTLDDLTGDVVDPVNGKIVIPAGVQTDVPLFTTAAAQLGGLPGLALLGLGIYIAYSSYQNTRRR